MGESANQPPTDVAELQARLATALAERDAAIAARDRREALLQENAGGSAAAGPDRFAWPIDISVPNRRT